MKKIQNDYSFNIQKQKDCDYVRVTVCTAGWITVCVYMQTWCITAADVPLCWSIICEDCQTVQYTGLCQISSR